jgi:4-hydroxy-tetrahydrodipicolinate reductase
MRIALIGYGKMGKAIEQVAIAKGHTIALKIGSTNLAEFTIENLKGIDVAIEFSTPQTVVSNLELLINAGVPVVCGTTAWLQHLPHIESLVSQKISAFIYASNFSVGVNIVFEFNKKLAQIMQAHASYTPSIEEIHHTQKLDAPSGTAITLAEGIKASYAAIKTIVNNPAHNTSELSIISKRIDPAPGTHSIIYSSAIDDIELKHTAHNRTGFAGGAVVAAEFLLGKAGVYTMKEVLGL